MYILHNLDKLEKCLDSYPDKERFLNILERESDSKTRNILRFYKEYYLESELQKEAQFFTDISVKNPCVQDMKICLNHMKYKPLLYHLGDIKEVWQLLDLLYESLAKGELSEEFVLQSKAFEVFVESLEQDIRTIDYIPDFLCVDKRFREHCMKILFKRDRLLLKFSSKQKKWLITDVIIKNKNWELFYSV